MKKLFLVVAIVGGIAGVTLAQAHPSKKTSSTTTTKIETKRDSVGGATASTMNKHKAAHKKGAHKKA